jgi:hypothetical protein
LFLGVRRGLIKMFGKKNIEPWIRLCSLVVFGGDTGVNTNVWKKIMIYNVIKTDNIKKRTTKINRNQNCYILRKLQLFRNELKGNFLKDYECLGNVASPGQCNQHFLYAIV